MANFNFLAFLSIINPPEKEMVGKIISRMETDRKLAEFIIEQSKAMLFISTGNGQPTEKELINACMNTIISIIMKLDGAIIGYQYFLDHGLAKYLEFMHNSLFEDDFNEKVG